MKLEGTFKISARELNQMTDEEKQSFGGMRLACWVQTDEYE